MTATHAQFIRELGDAHRAQVRDLKSEAQQLAGRHALSGWTIEEVGKLLAKAYALGRNHEGEMSEAKEEATA